VQRKRGKFAYFQHIFLQIVEQIYTLRAGTNHFTVDLLSMLHLEHT